MKREKEYVRQPITGYRAFRLNVSGRKWDVTGKVEATDPYLGSINVSFGAWYPGVNVAEHAGTGRLKGQRFPYVHGRQPCPEAGDHCGFWMLHHIEHALDKVEWDIDLTFFPVVGVVQGWGRVQEHGDGYRVQYATVIALALYPYNPQAGVTAVAYDLGCETLKRICRQFDVPYLDNYEDLVAIKRKLDGEGQT